MNEHIRGLFNSSDTSAVDSQVDGAVPPSHSGIFAAVISDNLQNRWLEEEPGEKCFDRDEDSNGFSSVIYGREGDLYRAWGSQQSPSHLPQMPVHLRSRSSGRRGRQLNLSLSQISGHYALQGSRFQTFFVRICEARVRLCSQARK